MYACRSAQNVWRYDQWRWWWQRLENRIASYLFAIMSTLVILEWECSMLILSVFIWLIIFFFLSFAVKYGEQCRYVQIYCFFGINWKWLLTGYWLLLVKFLFCGKIGAFKIFIKCVFISVFWECVFQEQSMPITRNKWWRIIPLQMIVYR